MKYISKTAVLVIFLVLCWKPIFGFNPPSCGDPWYYQSNDRGLTFVVPDKAQHYYGSYVLSKAYSKMLGKELGAITAFASGFLWEIKDSKTSLGTAGGTVGFSYRDLIADGFGVISSLINNERITTYVNYSTVRKEITFNIAIRW